MDRDLFSMAGFIVLAMLAIVALFCAMTWVTSGPAWSCEDGHISDGRCRHSKHTMVKVDGVYLCRCAK